MKRELVNNEVLVENRHNKISTSMRKKKRTTQQSMHKLWIEFVHKHLSKRRAKDERCQNWNETVEELDVLQDCGKYQF